MELHGYPFTWERYPGTNKWVEIRLDRAIATSSWMHLFKDARLINLEASTSDHSPILLVPMAVDGLPRVRKQKFENAWLREPVCRRVWAGFSVQIKNELWLPSTDNPYVLTESDVISGQTVSTLMVTNERRWDEDLIKDVFLERDANLILAIPLADNNVDGWYWRKDKYGHY
ncbi:hypothetical protein POM88_012145 [Heracleum sosnowskyi]|uniref:Endonuclease/exonuclease/phosphatase domain-containing protein n=1 Tax=Heracleum sosnowskyi TaxID=360622 RepID=A0AAD8IXL9_9APIA|nr:hypothetical protein POM88_012145 [Heracleum sosnowskyi]